MYSNLPSLLTAVIAFSCAFVWSSVDVNAAPLIQPKQIHPDENNVTTVTLVVRPKRVTIPLENSKTFSYTARLYSVETDPSDSSDPVLPGPTINVVPGGTLNLTLKNQLGPDTEMPENMDSFNQFNTTNLHYHGLHSDPHIDDIFKRVGPGEETTYELPILSDENEGLFWYHAHKHGAAYMQIMGGLFGALSTGIPQQFAHMPSQILMIHGYALSKGSMGDSMGGSMGSMSMGGSMGSMSMGGSMGSMSMSGSMGSMSMGSKSMGDSMGSMSMGDSMGSMSMGGSSMGSKSMGGSMGSMSMGSMMGSSMNMMSMSDSITMAQCDADANTSMPANAEMLAENGTSLSLPSDYYLINGQRLPTVEMGKNTQTVLRFLSAVADMMKVNVTLPSECSYELYAIDGKPLKTTRTLPNFLCLQNGARYEVVATCNTPGTFTASRSGDDFFYIKVSDDSSSLPQAIERSAGHHVHNNRRQQQQVAFPVTFAQSARYSEANLATNSNTFEHEISFSQKDVAVKNSKFLIGSGSNCSSLQNDSTCFYDTFQGRRGTNTNAYHGFTPDFDQVVLLRIYGDPTDTMSHPFHIHTNHFEIVDFEPSEGSDTSLADYSYQIGDIVDTAPILQGVTTVKWRTGPYQNVETVYHCHVLFHEDLGMMSTYYVPSA